jgi:hypothetical protein
MTTLTTWGSQWGSQWGGSEGAFDFRALLKSHRWKQLEFAENWIKLEQFMADALAMFDAWVTDEARRVGIDSAVGDELDDWGAMVGMPRNGMDDALYVRAIKARARATMGHGDPQTFYDVVAIFSGGNAKATLIEAFPAKITIWLHGLTYAEQRQVGALFDGVPGLGIGCFIVIVDPNGVFQWSGPSTPTVTRHWSGPSSPASEHAGFAGGVTVQ